MVSLGWLSLKARTSKHYTIVVQKNNSSNHGSVPQSPAPSRKLAKTSDHRLYIRPHFTLSFRGETGVSRLRLVCIRIGVAENTDSRYRRQSHHIRLLLFLLGVVITR
jgi:hypothetical protein